MNAGFLLIPTDAPTLGSDAQVAGHYLQQTGYTCGAAALSMITGLSELECRKLAHTTTRGTSTVEAAAALAHAGFTPHFIRVGRPVHELIVELTEQSRRWALYLALEFRDRGTDSIGRRRTARRHHACVLAGGRLYDPGQLHEADIEAIDAGTVLTSYIIAEKPSAAA